MNAFMRRFSENGFDDRDGDPVEGHSSHHLRPAPTSERHGPATIQHTHDRKFVEIYEHGNPDPIAGFDLTRPHQAAMADAVIHAIRTMEIA